MGASSITQPIDLLKSRMQLSGELGAKRDHSNSFQAIRNIVRNEGVLALYCGLSANLLRQATYTTTRLGIYQAALEEINRYSVYYICLQFVWSYLPTFKIICQMPSLTYRVPISKLDSGSRKRHIFNQTFLKHFIFYQLIWLYSYIKITINKLCFQSGEL